jgi:outer membrane lipoprotein carrier protein
LAACKRTDFVKYSPHRRRATSRNGLVYWAVFWVSLSVSAQDDSRDVQGTGTGAGAGAGAGEAISKSEATVLERFVAEVSDLTAGFEQSRFDADGELIEEVAPGRFSLLRPDRFRWHQEAPFEQLFVADGEYLWYYDVDFEQVTREPLDNIAGTPALLLIGEGEVGESFEVSELAAVDGLDWIELTPLDAATSDFVSAKIGFDNDVPVVIEFIDTLGDLTRVDFFEIEVNAGLDAAQFQYEPPDGVDLIIND